MRTEADYREKVIAIRRQSGSDKVFGASGKFGHHFELKPKSAGEIRQFEKELGVELPPEYAQFLMECGCGAGPYYGLFCPSKVLGEVSALNRNLPPSGKVGNPNLDFPFCKVDAQTIAQRMENHHPEPHLKAPWLSDGCIPICEQGCTGYNALVTAGELRGTVWDINDDGDIAWWWPARRPCGLVEVGFKPRSLAPVPVPPTFRQWYDSWLERANADLADALLTRS